MKDKIKTEVNFNNVILNVIAKTNFPTIEIVVQNVIQALDSFLKSKKYNKKYYINQKINKLERDAFIKININNGKKIIELTEKGNRKLAYYWLCKKKNIKWDGKWRVVVFDVWEHTRYKRDLLRNQIKNFGFIQLQKSVWIYPYECEEFIQFLKTYLSFGKNIRYMVVEKLDSDSRLRKYFNLS